MKLYEVYLKKDINRAGIDDGEKVSALFEIWHNFAETGKCDRIVCYACPFHNIDVCEFKIFEYEKTLERRKKLLNLEVSV